MTKSSKSADNHQVITMRNISDIIRANTEKALTNAVPSPSAQSPELCVTRTAASIAIMAKAALFVVNQEVDIRVRMLTELMMVHGLRVSEVLRITNADVSTQGRIKIHASKGSQSRIVHSPRFSDIWVGFKTRNMELPPYLNRWYMYRIFTKYGLKSFYTQGTLNSVTHVFRKLLANDAFSIENDKNDVSTALGHKNPKSANYYV